MTDSVAALPSKESLEQELVERLDADCAAMERAPADAMEAATHAEAKPENDKDTRALEASHLARWALPVAVLGLLGAVLCVDSQYRAARCNVDEPAWLTSGALAWQLVTEGAGPARWSTAWDELQLGDWGNKNPPVGKVMIGAIVVAAREGSEPVRYSWVFPHSYQWNALHGRLPPEGLLLRVRMGIAVLGGLTLVLAWLAAVGVTRRPLASLVAPGVLFFSNAFAFHSRTVRTDVPQLFWLMAALAALVSFARTARSLPLVLGAVCAGLACATKFSSAPLVVGAVVFVAARPAPARARALRVGVLLLLPALVFVAVNPYLYDAPLEKTLGLISAWSASKQAQQADPNLAKDAVHSRWQALQLVAQEGVVHPSAVLRGLTGALALAALLLGWFRVRPAAPRAEWLALLLTLLAALGLDLGLSEGTGLGALGFGCVAFSLGAPLLRADRPARLPEQLLVLCLFTVMFSWTVAWLPFNWQRYYLPVLSLWSVVLAWGVAETARLFEVTPRWPGKAAGISARGTPA